jgi:hypothetical protein
MAGVNIATSTSGSEFSKLRDVILRHSALLPRVIADLARVRGLDPELRQALVDVIRSETVPTYRDSLLQELGSGAFDPCAQLSECRSGRGSRHGTDESHHSALNDDVRLAEVTFRSMVRNEVVRMMITIAGGMMGHKEEPST